MTPSPILKTLNMASHLSDVAQSRTRSWRYLSHTHCLRRTRPTLRLRCHDPWRWQSDRTERGMGCAFPSHTATSGQATICSLDLMIQAVWMTAIFAALLSADQAGDIGGQQKEEAFVHTARGVKARIDPTLAYWIWGFFRKLPRSADLTRNQVSRPSRMMRMGISTPA